MPKIRIEVIHQPLIPAFSSLAQPNTTPDINTRRLNGKEAAPPHVTIHPIILSTFPFLSLQVMTMSRATSSKTAHVKRKAAMPLNNPAGNDRPPIKYIVHSKAAEGLPNKARQANLTEGALR